MALTFSEKITLTKRIGEALRGEKLIDIDLALDTFGVPEERWPDHPGWESERYEYVLRRLTGVNGDILVALHAHLYPDSPGEVPVVGDRPAGPWKQGHFRLFISHTNANKVLAGEIRDQLATFGIDGFVAHEMIEPTKEWQDEIETALGTCDALVAILTEDFVQSKWCDQEVGYALGRGRLIIAVHQGATPHGFIGKFQAVPGDATPLASYNIAYGIYESLRIHDMTKAAMAPAAAYMYAHSASFDEARTNLERLLEMPKEAWTDQLVQLVEEAASSNSQLAWGKYNGREIPTVVRSHLDALLERKPQDEIGVDSSPSAGDDITF